MSITNLKKFWKHAVSICKWTILMENSGWALKAFIMVKIWGWRYAAKAKMIGAQSWRCCSHKSSISSYHNDRNDTMCRFESSSKHSRLHPELVKRQKKDLTNPSQSRVSRKSTAAVSVFLRHEHDSRHRKRRKLNLWGIKPSKEMYHFKPSSGFWGCMAFWRVVDMISLAVLLRPP